MRRKRRESPEINLTPLLDVLFVVLFVVMLLGDRNLTRAGERLTEAEEQLSQIETQLSEATKESEDYRDRLSRYESAEGSLNLVSLKNEKTGDDFCLFIYEGMSGREVRRVVMKSDVALADVLSSNITAAIDELIAANPDKLTYVIFQCDESTLYNINYNTIQETLDNFAAKYDDFFYKIT